MMFQFFCPQGHLLEADLSQVGQKCMCPYCQGVFLVPEPARAQPIQPLQASQQPESEPARPHELSVFAQRLEDHTVAEPPVLTFPGELLEQSALVFPGVRTEPKAAAEDITVEKAVEFPRTAERELPPLVRILCPSGHELETPREMLGQDALCPNCQAQFLLRYEDSLEYRQEKAEQRQRHEEAIARAWMKWSIIAAIVVVGGVIVMLVMALRM